MKKNHPKNFKNSSINWKKKQN